MTFALVTFSVFMAGEQIIKDIVEDYHQLIADYQASETRQLFESHIAELTSARLLGNKEVLTAHQRSLVEGVRLNWKQREVGGIIIDSDGSTLLTTFPPDLTHHLISHLSQNFIEVMDQEKELFGRVEQVHPWEWQVATIVTDQGYRVSGRMLPLVLPLLILGPLVMLVSLFFILRRQVQQPVNILVRSMTKEEPVAHIGVTEFDRIGEAFNQSLSRLVERSVSLTQELVERKRAEQVIRTQEERIRLLLNSTAEGIYGIDESGLCTFSNTACCQLLGYSEAELLGKNLHELIHHSHADGTSYLQEHCPILHTFRTGQTTRNDSEIFWRADGAPFAVEYWSHPIMENNTVRGVMVAFFDITQRKQAQEALKAEKNKFEAIIAGMGDGVSIQDKNYTIIYQNEVHKGFVGDHLEATCYKAYEHRDNICQGCPVALAMADGKVHSSERCVESPTGERRYFEINASPLRDGTGAIIGGIEVVRDSTERRRAEEQLIQAQKMEGIGHLAGGVAHDFNNVLNVVQGYGELLQLAKPNETTIKEYTGHILEAVRRGANITRQILSFSRKEAMTVKTFNLNELVAALQKMLRRLVREDIDIQITTSDTPLMVSADAGQIDQVIINLTTNACHAMPNGGTLRIETKCATLDDTFVKANGFGVTGPYAVVTVTDTGIGMDESVCKRMFEPFFTTKEVGKGTGLGLSMVYGIIKKHHGVITVSSQPGQGTTCNIYLPLISDADLRQNETKTISKEETQQGTETILVAEDDPALRGWLQTWLSMKGYTVITAEDGEDAVQKFDLSSDNIHMVLLDGIMPRKNGKEALLGMRARRPGLKAIILSGYAEDVFTQKELQDLNLTFLDKPVEPDLLMRTIRQVLDEGDGTARLNFT